MVTIQVTLLFQDLVQGFSEDGVFTRWFLGKFAPGSCLAMENQTELVQESAESWAQGSGHQCCWDLCFGRTSRLMPHPGKMLVLNLSHLQWNKDTLPLPSQIWGPKGNPAWGNILQEFPGAGSALCCTSAFPVFLWPLSLSLSLPPSLSLPSCQEL